MAERRLPDRNAEADKLDMSPTQFREQFQHLAKAPLRVFVAEFLTRNGEFIKDCLELHKTLPEGKANSLYGASLLADKYGVLPLNWRDVIARKTDRLDVKILPPVRAIRVIQASRADEVRALQAKRVGALSEGDMESATLYHIRDTKLNCFSDDQGAMLSEKQPAIDYLMGGSSSVEGGEAVYRDDVLLLSVNLRRPKQEVHRRINTLLDTHLASEDRRIPRSKWMMYLMVFDLITTWNMSRTEAMEFMAKVFPDLMGQEREPHRSQRQRGRPRKSRPKPTTSEFNLFESEETIRNYHQEAVELISGKYLKYL